MICIKPLKKELTTFRIIIYGFAGVIIVGALLLMLPFSSRQGVVTPFSEALFTSTSAVCVTGLVVHDTATYWSYFGQAIILTMIQIGGLGVITVAAFFSILSGRRISLLQRSTMQEAISARTVGGVVRLTSFVLKATLFFELAGVFFMMPVFFKDYGLRGIWMSFFHSVSAFCNAGFDIMGRKSLEYASLTSYQANPVINLTIMLLIVIGGIGFLTWDDLYIHGYRFKRYRLQTKVILVTTAVLILLPAALFYQFEFAGLGQGERILSAFFQSVTTRTAGFNTANLNRMTGNAQAVMILLMLIGGSPGSTAGGMKTTTIAVLLANCFSVFRREQNSHFFGRRFNDDAIKHASSIFLLYTALFMVSGLIISRVESLPLKVCLYETASAIGTVGLTLGITPHTGLLSRGILIGLMFFGRVGGLTIIYAAISSRRSVTSRFPEENITVG